MFKNYFKVALRIFRRNPVYGLLNISGFAIGMSVCLALWVWVYTEWSYDRQHPDAERVYRVQRMWKDADGNKLGEFCSMAPSFTPLFKDKIPEVEIMSRVVGGWGSELKKDEQTTFQEPRFFYAESDVFQVLDIQLIEGDPATALAAANTMIVSEEMAEKYFKTEKPVGNILEVNGSRLIITGVFENLNENSHLDFDFLGSYSSLRQPGSLEDDYFLGTKNFSDNVAYTYMKIAKGSSIEFVEEKIGEVLNERFKPKEMADGSKMDPEDYILFNYMNVQDIHLFSKTPNEFKAGGDIQYVILFSIIALFILLLASLNFINLSVARSMKRVLEVSMRKVLGASKKKLIQQFMVEALFYTLISIGLAIILVKLLPILFPWIPIKNQPIVVIVLGAMIFLVIGLISGMYPSIYLSKQQVLGSTRISVLSGNKGGALRAILVGIQFVITISMIIGLMMVGKQIRFLQEYDLGFKTEGVITVPLRSEIAANWKALKFKLEESDDVAVVSRSKRVPTEGLWDNPGFNLSYNGKTFTNQEFNLPHVRVDVGFLETYQIELLAGRDFDPGISSDERAAYILNESALQSLGIQQQQDAIGLSLNVPGRENGLVIGVVKDFNYESLKSEITPIVIYLAANEANTVSVRLETGNLSSSLAFIEKTIKEFIPNYNLEATFLDEKISQLYENENKMMKMLTAFTVIAIAVSCLGLIGLTLFIVQTRKKEVAIRKVMGAPVLSILKLISGSFMKSILVANAISWPIIWYVLSTWLGTYAYATDLNLFIFVIAGCATMILSLLVMWVQVYGVANANPILALREE